MSYSEQNQVDQPQKPCSLLKMSIMGFMALTCALTLLVFISIPFTFILGGDGGGPLEDNAGITTGIMLIGLITLPFFIVYYAINAWKSKHKAWTIFIIFFALIAIPIYWFKHILNIDWYKRPQTEFSEPNS
jgi:hypothetical protein